MPIIMLMIVFQSRIARKEGIRIIYIAVGEYVDPSNRWYEPSFMEECRQMAGSDENLIKVGLFEVSVVSYSWLFLLRLDMSIMDNVVKTMCDPIV
ncbi:hypothetical protein Y032_1077g3554 [Ancylostoma ceylanicum]|uniref:Uncharacterized protein n=1 Tax=Ancylostoma ceylanicum TaxID=53326 RepID=A0A016W658_9BILA|nr:hypothetical protein Y032_1077g3554 [Ancylostoma ceylanicum]